MEVVHRERKLGKPGVGRTSHAPGRLDCGYVADVMLVLNLAIPRVKPRSTVFISSLLILL
jgi:hypothetical protein